MAADRGHIGWRVLTPALVCAALSLALAPGASASGGPCQARRSTSGEWPVYGHDLANTRDQRAERAIGPSNVGSISAAWVFSTAEYGDESAFDTTPVVSGGCVFIGSAA